MDHRLVGAAELIRIDILPQRRHERFARSVLIDVLVFPQQRVHRGRVVAAERSHGIPELLAGLGVGAPVVEFERLALGEVEALHVALQRPQREACTVRSYVMQPSMNCIR